MNQSETVDSKEILAAMGRGEVVFYYQPRVDLAEGRVTGGEALIRWRRPDGALIPADHFIPGAERSGDITHITRAMFPIFLQDLTLLRDLDETLQLALNVSPRDLVDQTFATEVVEAVERLGLEPSRLQVELQAAALAGGDEGLGAGVTKLKAHGVGIGLDDFGRVDMEGIGVDPHAFTCLNIDRSVVGELEAMGTSHPVIEQALALAAASCATVVAKGVESALAHERARGAGCVQAQGYWLGKPMQILDFLEFLKESPRWPGDAIGSLRRARRDHLQWRRQLTDAVTETHFRRPADVDRFFTRLPDLDPRQTLFGRWLQSMAAEFAGIVEFEALAEPHGRCHERARDLVDGVMASAPRPTVSRTLEQLAAASIELLDRLHQLEHRVGRR